MGASKMGRLVTDGNTCNSPTPSTSHRGVVIPFSFEGADVRVINRDGEPWFVLADVCRVLEIGNPSDAARRLDDDEKATLDNTDGHSGQRGGAQSFIIINESGLWSLVMTSRKPAAKRFKKWVTAEVLPTIRKTGGYGVPQLDPNDPAQLRALLIGYSERLEQAKHALAIAGPKADAYDDFLGRDGEVSVDDAAKMLLGWSGQRLHRRIRDAGWTSKIRGVNTPLLWVIQQGFMTVRPVRLGNGKIHAQPMFTPKGVAALRLALRDGDLFLAGLAPARLLAGGKA